MAVGVVRERLIVGATRVLAIHEVTEVVSSSLVSRKRTRGICFVGGEDRRNVSARRLLVEQGLDAEFSWNGTDNMEMFECDDMPLYKEWEEKRIYEDELDEQRKKRGR